MLDQLTLTDGHRLEYAKARRNIVTRGVDLNTFVGQRFRVGDVECIGRRLGEPCAHVLVVGGGRQLGTPVVRRLIPGRQLVGRMTSPRRGSTAEGKVSTPSLMRLASRKSSGYVCSVLSICGRSTVSMSPRAIGNVCA